MLLDIIALVYLRNGIKNVLNKNTLFILESKHHNYMRTLFAMFKV